MAITIRDVAHAAGVSTATVSRALRGLPNVDDATRDRVQQVARDLDYVVSPSASRLASGRTGSIAVITPHISRWFFSQVISGIESVLQTAGMDLLLMTVSDPNDMQGMSPAPRLRRRVDGVLMIAVPPRDPQLEEVLALGMPTSLIGVRKDGVASVTIDDAQAARTATQHLVNLGHSRIGVIGGSNSQQKLTAEAQRYFGFREVMVENGLELSDRLFSPGYFTIAGGEQAMTELLSQRQPPSAVFCMSDEMAFGALRSLRSHGLQPGRDVSLVGIDGHDMSEYLELTTVAQPVSELGRIAAEAVLVQIRGDERRNATNLPTRLIVRGSTAQPE